MIVFLPVCAAQPPRPHKFRNFLRDAATETLSFNNEEKVSFAMKGKIHNYSTKISLRKITK